MNKVMLIGNVGRDPEVRYYEADRAVAQFPLATTERSYKLQNGTQVPEHTDWHNIVMWHELAKIAEKYVHKGDKLYIEGRLRHRKYDDKKGQRHSVTEVWAENMELLSYRQRTSGYDGTATAGASSNTYGAQQKPYSTTQPTSPTAQQVSNAAQQLLNAAQQASADTQRTSLAANNDVEELPF